MFDVLLMVRFGTLNLALLCLDKSPNAEMILLIIRGLVFLSRGRILPVRVMLVKMGGLLHVAHIRWDIGWVNQVCIDIWLRSKTQSCIWLLGSLKCFCFAHLSPRD